MAKSESRKPNMPGWPCVWAVSDDDFGWSYRDESGIEGSLVSAQEICREAHGYTEGDWVGNATTGWIWWGAKEMDATSVKVDADGQVEIERPDGSTERHRVTTGKRKRKKRKNCICDPAYGTDDRCPKHGGNATRKRAKAKAKALGAKILPLAIRELEKQMKAGKNEHGGVLRVRTLSILGAVQEGVTEAVDLVHYVIELRELMREMEAEDEAIAQRLSSRANELRQSIDADHGGDESAGDLAEIMVDVSYALRARWKK